MSKCEICALIEKVESSPHVIYADRNAIVYYGQGVSNLGDVRLSDPVHAESPRRKQQNPMSLLETAIKVGTIMEALFESDGFEIRSSMSMRSDAAEPHLTVTLQLIWQEVEPKFVSDGRMSSVHFIDQLSTHLSEQLTET